MNVATTKKVTFWSSLIIFLSILGPGIITGSVDNDVGGITTYSIAGAKYGYHLLWTLVPAFIVLVVIQEMNARMGMVTGKGLADLIRENTGVKATFFIFLGLLTADIGNTMAEFAGVAGSMQIFGVSKYIAVPLVAILVWILVVKGTYKMTEKIFLIFSVFLLTYVISALISKPQWHTVGAALLRPSVQFNFDYLTMVVGIIGTTIAPWMQFYMQSAVIEKGLKMENYRYTIWDVVIGSVLTIVVAVFIIIACAATLHSQNIQIHEAKDAALALKPLAGVFASQIFAFGLFVAAVFSATILPIAASFYICEAFGFEAGVDKKLKEAPQFYTLFTTIILIAVAVILIPNAPLIQIITWSQVLNGLLLPVVLVAMMLLVNNRELMGEYVNRPLQNGIGWVTAVTLIVLSVLTVFMTLSQLIGRAIG